MPGNVTEHTFAHMCVDVGACILMSVHVRAKCDSECAGMYLCVVVPTGVNVCTCVYVKTCMWTCVDMCWYISRAVRLHMEDDQITGNRPTDRESRRWTDPFSIQPLPQSPLPTRDSHPAPGGTRPWGEGSRPQQGAKHLQVLSTSFRADTPSSIPDTQGRWHVPAWWAQGGPGRAEQG